MRDDLSIEPKGYDTEGEAIYPTDLLDLRWRVLMDDLRTRADAVGVEDGVDDLICRADVDQLRQAVEMFGLLVEREILRRGHPALLDRESGRGRHWEMVVEELRADPEGYARVVACTGWPSDPALLDEEQLDWAQIGVMHPEVLKHIDD